MADGFSSSSLFSSFFLGGFESACHINPNRERVDMIAGVEHDQRATADYRMLRDVGIRAARDGVRWHRIDCGGSYDFSSFLPMLQAAIETRTQVIWNLFHYGWPDGLDIFSAEFVDRFARYCAAVARLIREHTDEIPFYAPVNEISFFSWAAAREIIYPFAHGRDDEIKRQLVRAAVAACEAIWSVDSRARFAYPEPVIHVFAAEDRPEDAPAAASYNSSQYEAWDMIAGRSAPELGGAEKYLDVVGVNYYHANQWEHGRGRLRWEDEPRDPRWIPFDRFLSDVWARYSRPLFVSETSHFGAGRPRWIREIGRSVRDAMCSGIPVEGICLYPILDRYDWENREHWHNSGLWDIEHRSSGLERVLNAEYATAVGDVQYLLASGADD
jgi:beta-glucosidase/6-phospho-beta-glucosidase/beta-galactosidase